MAAGLGIQHGSPVWLSPSIVPSRDTVVSPGSSPSVAAVTVTSTNVFVYVKVDNIGTVELGACLCAAPVPAPWPAVTQFAGFLASTAGTTSASRAGFTFTASPAGDNINGPGVNFLFGVVASGRRAWDWSPDGRFFAYASAFSGNDWNLTVIALQNITRSDGTVILPSQLASRANGVYSILWSNINFGWANSQAVVTSGPNSGGTGLSIACPYAPGGLVWGSLTPAMPGLIDYVYLVSPCGSVVAIVPKVLVAGAGAPQIAVVSTSSALSIQFTKNNVPTAVAITGPAPSITTVAHTANGTQIVTGSGTVSVDDPDCTMVGGGVVAWVDRVKASTLPSGNLGVMSVGSGMAAGSLKPGQSSWVQVPNSNPLGWANQGEQHWCLLAQAYTSDGTTVARPWNGQAPSPPAFPNSAVNCAQHNIAIS